MDRWKLAGDEPGVSFDFAKAWGEVGAWGLGLEKKWLEKINCIFIMLTGRVKGEPTVATEADRQMTWI